MAGHEREEHNTSGFGRSDKQTFTIVNGNTGANVEAVNLGRNYAYIVIRCDNCQYIQAGTTLGLKVAMDESQALNSAYNLTAGTLAILALSMPTSGSLHFLCVPVFGAQYVHLTLSKNASGGSVVFDVYGLAGSIAG